MKLKNSALVLCQNLLKQKHNLTWLCRRQKKLTAGGDRLDEDYIKSLTIVSNDHLTPELKLHLITPKCEAWFSDPSKLKFENDPFWAIYWPGGQALSRYILDNRHLFRNKNILDVGSGSGACAIAAAKCEANIVLANDIDYLSVKAIKLNSDLNNVNVHVEKDDLIGRDIDTLEIRINDIVIKPKWDIVLIGDMFYDSEFSNRLFTWLCLLNAGGKAVYIGDPGRYAMEDILQIGRLTKVADYAVMDNEHFGFSSLNVWKISSSN